MKYADMTWGTMEAVVNKLGGMDAVDRFLSGELVVGESAVQEAPHTPFELKVCKTVTLGLHKSPKDYKKALEQDNYRINASARQILDKVAVSPTETEIDLAVLTVADLGFKRATRYDAICKRIIEIGAQLCPAEVGPALRLSYEDQSVGEWNAIAMDPLATLDGGLDIFAVDHGIDEQWLSTNYGFPACPWGLGSRFVVVVPRK